MGLSWQEQERKQVHHLPNSDGALQAVFNSHKVFSRLGQIRAARVVWRSMKITPDLFQAYLKCPMKWWLRATGEAATGNTYAEWVKSQDESYRASEAARLVGHLSNGETVTSPEGENLKSVKWLLATNATVQTTVDSCAVESNIAALERIPSAG